MHVSEFVSTKKHNDIKQSGKTIAVNVVKF